MSVARESCRFVFTKKKLVQMWQKRPTQLVMRFMDLEAEDICGENDD